jgi:hypothetical protein
MTTEQIINFTKTGIINNLSTQHHDAVHQEIDPVIFLLDFTEQVN